MAELPDDLAPALASAQECAALANTLASLVAETLDADRREIYGVDDLARDAIDTLVKLLEALQRAARDLRPVGVELAAALEEPAQTAHGHFASYHKATLEIVQRFFSHVWFSIDRQGCQRNKLRIKAIEANWLKGCRNWRRRHSSVSLDDSVIDGRTFSMLAVESAVAAAKRSEVERTGDGPCDPFSFRFEGATFDKMRPTAWRLVKCLWSHRPDAVDWLDLAESVWQDHAVEVDQDNFGQARKDANSFFRDNGIPYRVKASKSRLF